MAANPAILQATATKTTSWTGATITLDEIESAVVIATIASFTGAGTSHQPILQGSADLVTWTTLLAKNSTIPWPAQTTNMAATNATFHLSGMPNTRYIRAGGTIVLVQGTGTLTGDGTVVADGDTVTIGTRVYRFKATMAQVDDIKIATGDAPTTLTNFFKAINASGVAGTNYFAGTVANTQVTATNPTGTTVVLTAIAGGTAGNAIATTETSAHLSFGAATLAGGVDHSSSITMTYQTPNAFNDTYEPDGFRA